jgi:hypothetical protein
MVGTLLFALLSRLRVSPDWLFVAAHALSPLIYAEIGTFGCDQYAEDLFRTTDRSDNCRQRPPPLQATGYAGVPQNAASMTSVCRHPGPRCSAVAAHILAALLIAVARARGSAGRRHHPSAVRRSCGTMPGSHDRGTRSWRHAQPDRPRPTHYPPPAAPGEMRTHELCRRKPRSSKPLHSAAAWSMARRFQPGGRRRPPRAAPVAQLDRALAERLTCAIPSRFGRPSQSST